MKFYGIDAQGYLKLQQQLGTTLPAFVPTVDERRLLYLNTGSEDRLYIGGDNDNTWIRLVLDDDSTYTNLQANNATLYHPKYGNNTTAMTVSSLTGDATNHLRITSQWLKLTDNTPVGSNQVGIKLEDNSVASDVDDIMFYYDGSDSYWKFDGGGYSADIIATRAWVTSQVSASAGITEAQGNVFWVRLDSTDWAQGIKGTVAQRFSYSQIESVNGFVRTSNFNAGEAPSASPMYTATTSTPTTVVQRDGSSDIYCNIMHGTATAAQYADLAEKYTCDESTPIGTVMEVSFSTDDEVVPCMFELSPSVIGVVSANPAHIMNSEGEGLPIGLTGRVPVRVIGPIWKGDFIVAAGDGLARKGEPEELQFKMGVSLDTDLQEEEKLVECIIK